MIWEEVEPGVFQRDGWEIFWQHSGGLKVWFVGHTMYPYKQFLWGPFNSKRDAKDAIREHESVTAGVAPSTWGVS